MVRFSDMLGGDGDADEARAKTAPRDLVAPVDGDPTDADAPPDADADAQVEVEVEEPAAGEPAPAESAQAVLDRLTQYATASRAADQTAPEPTAPQRAPDDESGAGDDILPRGKRSLRNPRGSKRAK